MCLVHPKRGKVARLTVNTMFFNMGSWGAQQSQSETLRHKVKARKKTKTGFLKTRGPKKVLILFHFVLTWTVQLNQEKGIREDVMTRNEGITPLSLLSTHISMERNNAHKLREHAPSKRVRVLPRSKSRVVYTCKVKMLYIFRCLSNAWHNLYLPVTFCLWEEWSWPKGEIKRVRFGNSGLHLASVYIFTGIAWK